MKKAIVNFIILIIIFLLLIIWFLSGFPFRYIETPNLYAIVFDSVLFLGLIFSMFKFRSDKKLVVFLLLFLIFFSIFMINKVDPKGDCVELGKVWDDNQKICLD